jgi:hypothetical protein
MLVQQHRDVMRYPKRANVGRWLGQYETLVELMEEANLPNV